MKGIWSPFAIGRVVEEASFIARDKPVAAERWTDDLFDRVERLEQFPDSGHEVPELPRTKYRQLVYGRHRVVFAREAEAIHILTVRRFKKLLELKELTADLTRATRRSEE